MLFKLNPRHRMYDCPITKIEHNRSILEALLIEKRERQREQREQEVRLILSTSRLANQQHRDLLAGTHKALRATSFLDHLPVIVGAAIVGFALGWMVFR